MDGFTYGILAACSEELDLDGSDTSSEGYIEPGEPEEHDLEEGWGV